MRFLLDTHTLLWVSAAPEFLSERVMALFSQTDHEFYVSAATGFELATKHRLGKLPQAEKLLQAFDESLQHAGFRLLSITSLHGRTAGAFPHTHKDPFDRILAAQSLLEQMTLLSADTQLDAFGIQRLW